MIWRRTILRYQYCFRKTDSPETGLSLQSRAAERRPIKGTLNSQGTGDTLVHLLTIVGSILVELPAVLLDLDAILHRSLI